MRAKICDRIFARSAVTTAKPIATPTQTVGALFFIMASGGIGRQTIRGCITATIIGADTIPTISSFIRVNELDIAGPIRIQSIRTRCISTTSMADDIVAIIRQIEDFCGIRLQERKPEVLSEEQ
jgi:hypothetical protein